MAKTRMNINDTAKKFITPSEKEVEEKEETIKKQEKTKTKTKNTRPFIKDGGFSQRAYYITEDQYTNIKLLSVVRNTDTSSIVREALKEYLEKNNKELPK